MFKRELVYTLTFLLLVNFSAVPDWIQSNGPFSGYSVYGLVTQGNTIYAGLGYERMYKSKDLGANWTIIDTGLPTSAVTV
jgi:hypothetical protein